MYPRELAFDMEYAVSIIQTFLGKFCYSSTHYTIMPIFDNVSAQSAPTV